MSPGRRDLNRMQVRARIEDAAYRLFASQGYAATTTAEVAAAAGVSARTLFRYFPAKADLVFGESAAHTGVLLEAVRARPAGEPAVAAALAGARTLATHLDDIKTSQRARIVYEDPTMQARARDVLDAWIEELATALCPRLDDDLHAARTVATSVMHLLNQAVGVWLEEGGTRGALPATVDRLGGALVPHA